MLHAIRERATGWVAYFIVILISIPFALWGISEYLGFGGGAEVAEVNGTPIPIEEFNRLYQRGREQNPTPPGVDPEQWKRRLTQQVLGGLIDRELLTQYLDAQRLDIPDAALAQSIRDMDVFHVDGKFDEERYRRILEANRISAAGFEQEQRSDLRTRLIAQALQDSVLVARREIEEYRTLKDQTRDIRYFEISRDRFLDRDAVSEEEMRAKYEEFRDHYRTPERARVSYVELRLSDLDETELSEEAIAAYHQERALDFMAPELRRVRQIFLAPEASEQARELYARLQAGEDFAQLAQAHSEDAMSRDRGGEIGWVAQEDLPEDLGTLMFSLTPGQASEPISTQRGLYLLEVEEIQEARLRALEEVRDQVVEQARRADLEGRYAATAEELDLLAYENPESLEVAAERLGLDIQTTGLISLAGLSGRVLGHAAVQPYLRREEVLRDGMNSDRIELEADWSVVVRVDDYQPPQTRDFEDVADQLRENLAQAAAQQALLSHALELTEQLRQDPDLEALAKRDGSRLKTRIGLTRDAQDLSRPVRDKAFSLARPEGLDIPVLGLAVLIDGIALVAVDAVHERWADAGAEDRAALRAQTGRAERAAFQAALRAPADVVRYPERLE